jgi:hypothetical protein
MLKLKYMYTVSVHAELVPVSEKFVKSQKIWFATYNVYFYVLKPISVRLEQITEQMLRKTRRIIVIREV